MNATTNTRSTETFILSSQQLGAFTRKARAAGKNKPGWVARTQEQRAERARLHAQIEAANEANRDAIEEMAKRIRADKARKIAKFAPKPTAPTLSKPVVNANGRVRRTPEQEKAFRLLQIKSGRRIR